MNSFFFFNFIPNLGFDYGLIEKIGEDRSSIFPYLLILCGCAQSLFMKKKL
jgi:hypothetical protein